MAGIDDSYPNPGDNLQTTDMEGWIPEENEAQQQAKKQEDAKLASSIGVVSDVMVWLEAKKKAYEGIGIISGVNASTKAEDVKSAVLLNQQMLHEMNQLLRDFRVQYAQYITEEPIE